MFGMGTGGAPPPWSPETYTLVWMPHRLAALSDRNGTRTFKTVQGFALLKVSNLRHMRRSSLRPISTRQLKPSRALHLGPINLIIFEGSYQLTLWECSS